MSQCCLCNLLLSIPLGSNVAIGMEISEPVGKKPYSMAWTETPPPLLFVLQPWCSSQLVSCCDPLWSVELLGQFGKLSASEMITFAVLLERYVAPWLAVGPRCSGVDLQKFILAIPTTAVFPIPEKQCVCMRMHMSTAEAEKMIGNFRSQVENAMLTSGHFPDLGVKSRACIYTSLIKLFQITGWQLTFPLPAWCPYS